MTLRLNFCMKAIKTLGDRDISVLTDTIESYVNSGMDSQQAALAAVSDMKVDVVSEREALLKLFEEQHKGAKPMEEDGIPFKRDEPEQPTEQPQYIRSQPNRKSMPADEVRAVVDLITDQWANAPQVVVLNTFSEAAAHIKANNQDQMDDGAEGDVSGFFSGGKVYIIADQVKNTDQVVRVLFHEALGHAGLRGTFGSNLRGILNKFAAANEEQVRKKAKQYGLDMNKPTDRLLAAEEVLAEMAEKAPESTWVQQIIAAIRDFLRDLGIRIKYSDADIVANFIRPARRFIVEGEAATEMEGETAYARAPKTEDPFYSELFRQVAALNIKSASPDSWKQAIKGLSSKGVKADEVAWSGIDEWLSLQTGKVTKDQVLDYLDANGVQVTETVLGETKGFTQEMQERLDELEQLDYRRSEEQDEERQRLISMENEAGGEGNVSQTKYAQYTLPGGTNYREVLLTLPTTKESDLSISFDEWLDAEGIDPIGEAEPGLMERYRRQIDKQGKFYISGHWVHPNVLAHIRLNDRTDAEGRRVLFVEEIQSDWGQAGKKKGFAGERVAAAAAVSAFERDVVTAAGGWDRLTEEQQEEYQNLVDAKNSPIPSAPFVGKTDAWVALAVKRVIKMAVDEGYDRVAFVNGAQSAERYSLSKQVNSIEWTPRTDPTGKMDATTHVILDTPAGLARFNVDTSGVIESAPNPGILRDQQIVGKRLDEVIGKGPADRIMGEYRGKMEGEGLNIGGEGMKAFYDKIVPGVVKDVLKKLGGQMGAPVNLGPDVSWDERKRAVAALWPNHNDQMRVPFPEQDRMITEYLAKNGTVRDAQPGFDITPSMREKAAGGLPMFMRMADLREMNQEKARNLFLDAVTSYGKVNLWGRTVGTQYHKAQKNPTTFGRVFNAVQDYIKDTSIFANAAADQAPTILPKMETWRDVKKGGLTRHGADTKDLKASGAAVFQGTLDYARDAGGRLVQIDKLRKSYASLDSQQKAQELFKARKVTEQVLKMWQGLPQDQFDAIIEGKFEREMMRPGVVFTDAELRSVFKLSDEQIKLYREFRAATDQSLDDMVKAEIVRLGGKDLEAIEGKVMAAGSIDEATSAVLSHFAQLSYAKPEQKEGLDATYNLIADKANQVKRLKEEGYAPLMRFGRHTLHITKGGETLFFGMYESNSDANRARREMQADSEFKGADFKRGLMSQEAFKLYAGVSMDSLELFAQTTGRDSQVFQDFLKLTKSNRSAMKRMIHRQGIAGFSEDVSRVLASFVTSNARMAAGNLHMGKAKAAAEEIPKEMGDLKDDAVNLINYVQDPQEEAAGIRGLLFVNFIGGSVASAMVNLTQSFTMTLPYLSQFGGFGKASGHIGVAWRLAASGKVEGELADALKRAEKDGIVSPQEIHHLQAEAMNRLGNHPFLKKMAFVWGSMFGLAEQFNRRVSFISAYNVAKENHIADPFAFAEKAVVETQGLYNKGNKANWARGPIGATVMTFKQFSTHYLEFLTRMAKSGPEGKKAVAVALAILMLAAGSGGLPFADDLDDLVDTLAQALGYDFNAKDAKRRFISETLGMGDVAADVATRGLTALPGMPLDVSVRMGLGNLLPGTGALLRSNTDRSRDVLEFAGAAGGLAKSTMEAGGALLKGDVAAAGLKMAPVALQNVAKAAQMWSTGEYRNQRGQKVINVDEIDAAAKFIGFQPADVARESSTMTRVQRSIQLAKNVEEEIAGKSAQAVIDLDADAVAAARQELADWNEKNTDSLIVITPRQIKDRVRKMRETRADRTVRTAPKEMRQQVREAFQ